MLATAHGRGKSSRATGHSPSAPSDEGGCFPGSYALTLHSLQTLLRKGKGWGGLRRLGIWIVLILLSALTGCAFARANVGQPLSEEDIRRIQKGVTTKAQVVEALGTPDAVSHTLQHEVFQYRYGDGKLGVVLIFSRANYKTDDLYIFFDENDVVAEVIFGKRTDTVRFQFWPFGS